MDLLTALASVLAIVGVVAVFLLLDRLGNRWFQALPQQIRDKGLLGVAWERLRRRPPPR